MRFTDPTASYDESECGEIHTEDVGSSIQKSLFSTDAKSVEQFLVLAGHAFLRLVRKLALD